MDLDVVLNRRFWWFVVIQRVAQKSTTIPISFLPLYHATSCAMRLCSPLTVSISSYIACTPRAQCSYSQAHDHIKLTWKVQMASFTSAVRLTGLDPGGVITTECSIFAWCIHHPHKFASKNCWLLVSYPFLAPFPSFWRNFFSKWGTNQVNNIPQLYIMPLSSSRWEYFFSHFSLHIACMDTSDDARILWFTLLCKGYVDSVIVYK